MIFKSKLKSILILVFLSFSISIYGDVDIIADQEALPLVGVSYQNSKLNNKVFEKSLNFYLNIIPYFKTLPQNLSKTVKDGEKLVNIKFDKWRELKVEYLFKVKTTEKNGKLIVKVFIFSPIQEKKVWGKEYKGLKTNSNELAGFIANDIYSFFSAGKKGVFLTKIAYAIKVKGKKQKK